ncbi:Protein-tyrosine phosphatase, partial [Cooperia oncophora]
LQYDSSRVFTAPYPPASLRKRLLSDNSYFQFAFPFETSIKLEVTHLEVSVPGCSPHSCVHYHWVDWPDRGVPPADAAPLFLLHSIANIKTPIIIHCSAGIGRTGSMVLLETAMEVLARGDQLGEMNGYLQELRKQRNNSIQTDQQYLYVHQVLLIFLRRTGFVPQTLQPALDAFTSAYNAATSGF